MGHSLRSVFFLFIKVRYYYLVIVHWKMFCFSFLCLCIIVLLAQHCLCLQFRISLFRCLSIFDFAVVFMSIHLEDVRLCGCGGGNVAYVGWDVTSIGVKTTTLINNNTVSNTIGFMHCCIILYVRERWMLAINSLCSFNEHQQHQRCISVTEDCKLLRCISHNVKVC